MFMMVVQYINGGSLDAMLQDRSVEISWFERVALAADTARGMAYLHKQGVFHRDLTSKVFTSHPLPFTFSNSWPLSILFIIEHTIYIRITRPNPKELVPLYLYQYIHLPLNNLIMSLVAYVNYCLTSEVLRSGRVSWINVLFLCRTCLLRRA